MVTRVTGTMKVRRSELDSPSRKPIPFLVIYPLDHDVNGHIVDDVS